MNELLSEITSVIALTNRHLVSAVISANWGGILNLDPQVPTLRTVFSLAVG
jgi:hypothetical protein